MKTLIICIDRDDDLGRKASVDGPVVGRKNVLEAAVKLSLADPSETDANAMFAGIKLYKEVKGEKELAVLTGSVKVGYQSDMIIKKQLDSVLKNFKADGAIIVSDGKEDELVLPIIESALPVISLHRIVVHSGEELKGIYYSIASFLKRAKEDKDLAKLIFGVPGLVALSYALLGDQSWRLVAGILSGFLIIRGLQIEKSIGNLLNYIKESFINLSTSFFLYLVSGVMGIIAMVKTTYLSGATTMELAAKISIETAPLFFYSILALLIGLAIDSLPNRLKAYSFVSLGVGLGVIVLVARSVGSWILDPTYPLSYVVTTTLLGLAVVTMVKLSAKFIKQ
jgi:putative membrane protein